MKIVSYEDDIEQLRPLVESWKAQAGDMEGIVLDVEHLLVSLQSWLKSVPSMILVLKSDQGRALGFMGLCVFESPLGPQLICQEHFWYVLPEHRSMAVSGMFLDAAMAWCKEHRAEFFSLTASRMANVEMERVCRMYERWGFRHYESSFIKEVA